MSFTQLGWNYIYNTILNSYWLSDNSPTFCFSEPISSVIERISDMWHYHSLVKKGWTVYSQPVLMGRTILDPHHIPESDWQLPGSLVVLHGSFIVEDISTGEASGAWLSLQDRSCLLLARKLSKRNMMEGVSQWWRAVWKILQWNHHDLPYHDCTKITKKTELKRMIPWYIMDVQKYNHLSFSISIKTWQWAFRKWGFLTESLKLQLGLPIQKTEEGTKSLIHWLCLCHWPDLTVLREMHHSASVSDECPLNNL